MVVVYHEEEALADVKLFQKKRSTLQTIGITSGAIGLAAFWVAIYVGMCAPTVKWLEYCCGALAIVGILTLLIMGRKRNEIEPSAAARYYMAAKGRKVHGVRVEVRPGPWHTYQAVCLLTENDNGSIESTALCMAARQESLKVDKPTFDVGLETIFVPYDKEGQA